MTAQGPDRAKRHLLRLWLATPPPHSIPLPLSYRHMFKQWSADDRGLSRRSDGGWEYVGVVPLEAEVGQAFIPPAAPAGAAGQAGGGAGDGGSAAAPA
jgi:hypothetical protein